MLFKYDDDGMAQRPRRSNSWKNQSIWGVANRLLRRVDADDQHAAHMPLYVNVADLSFATVNKIILAAALALGLAYIAVMPRRGAIVPETFAIEAALLLLLVLLFTPLVFGYMFAWLLFPATVDRASIDATPRRRCSYQRGRGGCVARADDPVSADRPGLRQRVLRHAHSLRRALP